MSDEGKSPPHPSAPASSSGSPSPAAPESLDTASVERRLKRLLDQMIEGPMTEWLQGTNLALYKLWQSSEALGKTVEGLTKALSTLGPSFDRINGSVADVKLAQAAYDRQAKFREETQENAIRLYAAAIDRHAEAKRELAGALTLLSERVDHGIANVALSVFKTNTVDDSLDEQREEFRRLAKKLEDNSKEIALQRADPDEITAKQWLVLARRVSPWIAQHALPVVVSALTALGLAIWHLVTQLIHLH